MKAKFNRWSWLTLVMVAIFLALPHLAFASAPTVLTVPTDPLNPTFPHNTYNVCSDGTIPNYTTTPPTCKTPATLTEITIGLGATVPSASGSSDSFTVTWSFGDGSANVTLGPFLGTATTSPYAYDISTTHMYPASAAVGTAWTAVVTVNDTTNSTSTSANYYVIQEQDNLNSRVNVAIDNGLWYEHTGMWRQNTPANGQTVNWGGWDTQTFSCSGSAYDCYYYGSINASNVQAFEVSGHLASGPATDPYTDDVARGLARMLTFLTSEAVAGNTYQYNPATANFTCADGSIPQTTDLGACTGHGGQHLYNPGATSCTAPPCTITFDGNKNGLMTYSSDGSGEYSYTTSPFLDALVASGTPAAVAPTGNAGIKGATYANIVQDIIDFYGYSQYEYDYDVSMGYTRGYAGSDQGGAWLYSPQEGDDDSTSQWAAIAYLSGHAFGISIPPAITDFNNVWVTNAQDVGDTAPTGSDPFNVGDNKGAYGYRGSFEYSNAWGPFAVTPSGLVQMAMDGIGRTTNTVFGDGSTAFDQRWNNTETYYADNFCNSTASGAYYAPRQYLYGLFSFTKSMLLAVPTSIQYLRTQTPGVFSNPSDPPNSIDWYAALSSANGGADPCDGVAQTLVSDQQSPPYGTSDGHWYGFSYDGSQWPYETAWSIIMLRRTVFVSCINNLYGRGTPGNVLAKPRIDLTWSAQTNATNYAVFRGTVSGGPYTQVGTSTIDSFSDRTAGLVNGDTYYYVVQPLNGTSEICQSNEEKVVIP
jgi:hypothetical protein